MKKKEKAAATAIMASAAIQNNINLNLNTGDIVELMVEESKEALGKVYLDLYRRFNEMSWIGHGHIDITKLVLKEYEKDPVFKAAQHKYPIISVKLTSHNCDGVSARQQVVLDKDLTADQYGRYKDVLESYPVLRINPGSSKPALLKIEFDLAPDKQGEGVILVYPFSEELIAKVNKTMENLNAERLEIYNSLEKIGGQIKLLRDAKKSKAKFIRSILEKSSEGQEVLASISGIFNQEATKQLKR